MVASPAHDVQLKTLGIRVTPMDAKEVVDWIGTGHGTRLLLNHNLHSAYLYQVDSIFRDLYGKADRVLVDGMPILLAASAASQRRLRSTLRIGSTDWLAALSDGVPGRLLVFGATAKSNDRAVENLRVKLEPAGWTVRGMHGYANHEEAIDWMQAEAPSLVIVGLGMPLQERFLQENLDVLPPAVYATVGGAIDYIAGESALSPRWVGSMGLEWLWRLINDPKRLAHRYLVEPILLACALIARRRHADRSHKPGSPESA